MKFSKAVLGMVATFALTTAAFASNIVINPDFSPANTGNGYGLVAGWTQTPFPSTLYGFEYLTGSNSFGQPFWNNGTAGSATTVGFVQVYPGEPVDRFEQILNLIVGQTYNFSYLENSRSGSAPIVAVTIGGSSLIASHSVASVGGSNPFNLVTGTFTATSATEKLVFAVTQGNPGDDATALFTNVSAVAQTPEPSSLALLGTGLMGAVGMARRKLRKA